MNFIAMWHMLHKCHENKNAFFTKSSLNSSPEFLPVAAGSAYMVITKKFVRGFIFGTVAAQRKHKPT